jgi:hypothetical protein
MKLSEAIRLGSAVTRKCAGYFNLPKDDYLHPEQACVMGAALLAVGKLQRLCDRQVPFEERVLSLTGLPNLEIYRRLVMMNNETDMSREEIADWIVANGHDVEMPRTEPVEPEPIAESELITV